jgi:hypothetical protein
MLKRESRLRSTSSPTPFGACSITRAWFTRNARSRLQQPSRVNRTCRLCLDSRRAVTARTPRSSTRSDSRLGSVAGTAAPSAGAGAACVS